MELGIKCVIFKYLVNLAYLQFNIPRFDPEQIARQIPNMQEVKRVRQKLNFLGELYDDIVQLNTLVRFY